MNVNAITFFVVNISQCSRIDNKIGTTNEYDNILYEIDIGQSK